MLRVYGATPKVICILGAGVVLVTLRWLETICRGEVWFWCCSPVPVLGIQPRLDGVWWWQNLLTLPCGQGLHRVLPVLLFIELFGGTSENASSTCTFISDILRWRMLFLLLEAEFLSLKLSFWFQCHFLISGGYWLAGATGHLLHCQYLWCNRFKR